MSVFTMLGRDHMRLRGLVVALFSVLLATGCAGSTATNNPHRGPPRTLTGSLQGASYIIQVPSSWNGVLLLYSHGGGGLTANPPAENTIDPVSGEYLLEQGYAVAGSSFRSSGWFVEDALADDLALLSEFHRLVGRPSRTIVWGVSLGSMITLGLAERNPDRIDGALAMCGVVADAVPFWNQNLDAAFAFKVLFAENDSQIEITGSTPSASAGDDARSLLETAKATAIGRARTAIVAALREIPVEGFLATLGPLASPAAFPSGVSREELRAASLAELVAGALGDYFVNHPALEIRAGGNPSSNVGTDYGRLLEVSPDYAELRSLYAAAGLSINDDVARLNRAPRITASSSAVGYLSRFLSFSGDLRIPVMTLHTVADESTPVELEAEYANKVGAAGKLEYLRQLFVDRAGHCNFTTAEIAVGLQALMARVDSGKWGVADNIAALNSRSAGYGARYWVPVRTTVVGAPAPHSYPSFVAFQSIGLLRNAAQEP
jgi:pimeloyl-ACP methyl ester carboxylesterase